MPTPPQYFGARRGAGVAEAALQSWRVRGESSLLKDRHRGWSVVRYGSCRQS